jgi:5-oxoprolinase (ATP-hydrolysing)
LTGSKSNHVRGWQFWIDRGGTFTDIVAKSPAGTIIVYKLLSENPDRYTDAPIQGIKDVMGIGNNEAIEIVKMGTTVATNALLERKGDRVLLVINKGFKDALRIGYQNRPDIFARQIVLPTMLYERVIEVDARYDAAGTELKAIELHQVRKDLQTAYDTGLRSCAIVLMHAYRYPQQELQVAQIAQDIGFTQISISHQVSPLIKLISRGDTTVVDAYLTPILRRYIDRISSQIPGVPLMFMKSDGGLVSCDRFQGKDSILSGPAGGIVGAVETCLQSGFDSIITFDMGGTSTDVAHFNGTYERQLDLEIAGARMRVPVLAIQTIAAGGGSLLAFDGSRYRVGPESGGSNPGAACYRRGGELTVTDANVMLGKIQPQYFPAVFGREGNLPIDAEIVREKFTSLSAEIAAVTENILSPEVVASGFIEIAVENMANAIKKISLQRGYDITQYILCCFGGAGAQVACLLADVLGMKQIFIHPYAGVLSAYGIGLADLRETKVESIELPLNEELIPQLQALMTAWENKLRSEMSATPEPLVERRVNLKYAGTNSTLTVNFNSAIATMIEEFEVEHQSRYGFIQPEKSLIVESASVELIQKMETPSESLITRTRLSNEPPQPVATVPMFAANRWYDARVYRREDLQPQDCLAGAAIIVEPINTIIVEPNWQATLSDRNCLILKSVGFISQTI